MKEALILAIVAMIFLVIFQIAKASEYVSVLKGEEKTRRQSNKINGFLLVAFLIAGLIGVYICNKWFFHKTLFVQGSASVEGEEIDNMLYMTIAVTGVIFIITQVLLFWFCFKYQEKDGKKAFFFPHNTKLELIWTTVPAIFLTILVVFGLINWFNMTGPAPDKAILVEITGHQFNWEMRYPGRDGVFGKKDYKLYNNPSGNILGVDFNDGNSKDDLHTGEMHLPVNIPVKLIIGAQDVIHDVGLNHFRMKMDAVPGIPTTLWFTPKITTADMKKRTNNQNFAYEISCDQICGKGHYSMKGVIVVETEAEYKKWLSEQTPEYITLNKLKTPTPDSTAKAIEVAVLTTGVKK